MAAMATPVLSVERVIPATPEAVFALLSDAARHAEIDGSGTVKGTDSPSEPLSLGSEFGMSMQMGIKYSTVNRVVEFEPNARIAWQTLVGPSVLRRFVTGRTWRYELEPVEGGTLVRETWDTSTEAALSRPFIAPAAGKTKVAMERTLERIEKVLSAA
jgi:uncharacterized protein YndB with AHSA1/START domain